MLAQQAQVDGTQEYSTVNEQERLARTSARQRDGPDPSIPFI
jgi:hypothetical protein